MRHRKKRHLRGGRDRRRKELRALACALILYEKIETTKARAVLVKAKVEKLITQGKRSKGLATLRRLRRDLPLNAVKKILEVISPRYQSRPGGYTRLLNVGKYKDGTRKVLLEFVPHLSK